MPTLRRFAYAAVSGLNAMALMPVVLVGAAEYAPPWSNINTFAFVAFGLLAVAPYDAK